MSGALEERYGFDPREIAARTWLWRETYEGQAGAELPGTRPCLEVIVHSSFTSGAPNFVGNWPSRAIPDFGYAYWTPLEAEFAAAAQEEER